MKYDADRLRDDPEYRQQVLDKMTADTRSRWQYRRLLWGMKMIVGATLFAGGVFTGGWLTWMQSLWVTGLVVFLLIVPMMVWLLVSVRKYRQQKKKSKS